MGRQGRRCVAGPLGEAGLGLAMPSNWRHEHIALLCFGRGEPAYSHNHWPEPGEWQNWAVRVYRKAVEKANGTKGIGPMYVSTWLAIRAGMRGWDDLFATWADRAHLAGDIGPPLYKRLERRLALDERIEISWNRFHKDYEESFGYPLRASPLANKMYEERGSR